METSSVRSHQSSADSSTVATPTSASGGSNSNNFRSTPTAKSALRRAAIDIIGRGFVLWEPHLEVSKVWLFDPILNVFGLKLVTIDTICKKTLDSA